MRARLLTLVALCAVALAPATFPASAQDSAMVWGDALAANLDPHDPYDVPAALIQLNVYDNLYRFTATRAIRPSSSPGSPRATRRPGTAAAGSSGSERA
jgi:ABC-type oligopeptide transport system substrate-binding subunit